MKGKSALFVAATLLSDVAVTAGPVRTERAACDLVKARVAERGHFPVRRIALCDNIPRDSRPAGFYVLALHSDRRCDYICSSHLGWYAVRQSDGRVFEWDAGEQQLGTPIGAGF